MFITRIQERVPRSVLKMISWRLIIVLQYFFIGYLTTGSIIFGVGLASITTVINSTLYFFHERAWNITDYGRKIKK